MSVDEKTTKVVYHHVTGQALLVDLESGVAKPIEVDEFGDIEETALLKTKRGWYRTEVKNECKRLYWANVMPAEISRRTSVPVSTLEGWIHGHDRKSRSAKCWAVQKKDEIEDLRKQNADQYVGIERGVLERIDEFLQSKDSIIKTSRELKDFAEVVSKVLRPQDDNKGSQINILNQVTPLTPDEAKEILAADPIKAVAEIEDD